MARTQVQENFHSSETLCFLPKNTGREEKRKFCANEYEFISTPGYSILFNLQITSFYVILFLKKLN